METPTVGRCADADCPPGYTSAHSASGVFCRIRWERTHACWRSRLSQALNTPKAKPRLVTSASQKRLCCWAKAASFRSPWRVAARSCCLREGFRGAMGLWASVPCRRARGVFQRLQPMHGVCPAGTAHLYGRLKACAKGRTLWVVEDAAAFIVPQLDAAHPRRLTLGHPGDRGGDGGRSAAGTAARAAIHGRYEFNGWFRMKLKPLHHFSLKSSAQ